MTTTIRGWQAASNEYGIPVRTLRRLHKEGVLHGTKGDDGVWQFTLDALDAAADHLNAASAPAPAAPPVVAAAIAYPAEPEPAPTPRQAPVAAPWPQEAAEPDRDPVPEPERVERELQPFAPTLRPYWEQAELQALRTQVQQLQQALAQERHQHAHQLASLHRRVTSSVAALRPAGRGARP